MLRLTSLTRVRRRHANRTSTIRSGQERRQVESTDSTRQPRSANVQWEAVELPQRQTDHQAVVLSLGKARSGGGRVTKRRPRLKHPIRTAQPAKAIEHLQQRVQALWPARIETTDSRGRKAAQGSRTVLGDWGRWRSGEYRPQSNACSSRNGNRGCHESSRWREAP